MPKEDISHRIAAPANKRTANTNQMPVSLAFALAFPEPCVAVAVAAGALVVIIDVDVTALLFDEVAEVSIVVTTGVALGRDDTDTGPGPPRAERLWLVKTDTAEAGSVASGDAVSVTLKIAHIWAKAR